MIRCPFCKQWATDEDGTVDHLPECPELDEQEER